MKKAIVTGGAGFIGSNLASYLLNQGWYVVVIDDFSIGSKKNLPVSDNLKIIKDDVTDKPKMQKLVKNVDTVFHLAVQCVRKSIRDPWLVHDVNSIGTLSVLDAALKNNIKKFVYVSSSEVYGTAINVPMTEAHPLNPTTVYGASKLAGEYYTQAYFRTYGLPAVIVRPFNTYGYNEHFEGPYGEVIPRFVVRSLNGLPKQIFGDGSQTRDFTFVTDTVKGMLKVAERGKLGEVYNIARGEEVSVLNLAQVVARVLNKEVHVEHLDPRPGDVLRLYANCEKARRELGFISTVPLEKGVKEYVKWFKSIFSDPKEALKFYEQQNW